MKRNAAERIEEGQHLLKVKASMKHGEWLTWLKVNAHYSIASAQRFMREARAAMPQSKADETIEERWQLASMEERCAWMS